MGLLANTSSTTSAAALGLGHSCFVAGHNGLVGSAVVRRLKALGIQNILTKSRNELDLENQNQVDDFYKRNKPDLVFVCAAKVGGIHANNTYRADFLYRNLQIQNNLIWGAHKANVNRLIFLGSSCIYPRDAAQPITETSLLTGPLEFTNRPYAIAKIAGLELVDTLRRQYGRDYYSLMPTNLYGPHDNFDLETSHVVPALIRKFVEAVDSKASRVMIWGSGKPLRELMYIDDCAEGIVFAASNFNAEDLMKTDVWRAGFSHINLGSGFEISIGDLARTIGELTNFEGDICYDDAKPDGTPRKMLNNDVMQQMGFVATTTIRQGLEKTIAWYMNNRK